LLINQRKIKKNKEKQHTLRWEKKRMLDLRWEGESEEKRKIEKWRCETRRWRPDLSWFKFFILVFTDEIIDGKLNINIFNIFFSICKVKWKFSTCAEIFRKPLLILPTTFYFVGDSIGKKNEQSKDHELSLY
jgi:hypothetical protein